MLPILPLFPPHAPPLPHTGKVGHFSSFGWVRVASGFPLGVPSKAGKVETMADHVGTDSEKRGLSWVSRDLTGRWGWVRTGKAVD